MRLSISLTVPAFGFDPLTSDVVESSMMEQVNIIVNNGLTFGAGVSRSVIVSLGGPVGNSPATGNIQLPKTQ
jgi:hypothetical protein